MDLSSLYHRGTRGRPVVLHARVVTGPGGGPDKTILNSPRYLKRFGYRSLCAYMRPPGDAGFEHLMQTADALEAPLVAVDDRGPLDARVVTRLLSVCRRHRVSVWHGHDYKSNALGLLLRRFWPMRLVTTVHGWVKHTRRTPLYYSADRACLRFYDHVICVSEDLHRDHRRWGVSPGACSLVENAIDTDKYMRTMSAHQARQRLGLPLDGLLIGAVGRLSSEKGFDRLIRAVDRLLNRGSRVHLVIAGDGEQRAALEALIGELNRRDAIQLLGYRRDVPELLQAMDVFVLSSLREGLPNVVLEAMAMQVPTVATRINGIPRIVAHRGNGLLVEPDSVDQLAAGLDLLLTHPEMRRRLAAAAWTTVRDRYGFAARMRKVSGIYRRVLARSRRGAGESLGKR